MNTQFSALSGMTAIILVNVRSPSAVKASNWARLEHIEILFWQQHDADHTEANCLDSVELNALPLPPALQIKHIPKRFFEINHALPAV